MEYTMEVYKKDGRVKSGERFVESVDLGDVTYGQAEAIKLARETQGCRVELKETYVTRKNYMTGVEFQERYDTPYFCSASSESYFSM
jgi:hypothetical protein